MVNITKKYKFKIEIDQFGNKYDSQDFFDTSEEILIHEFEKISQQLKSYNQEQYSIIELGCNQCFYSILFFSIIDKYNTKLLLVEPYSPFLERGLRNLEINNINAEIINKCVGRKKWLGYSPDFEFDVELVSLRTLIQDSYIDILHCDIDGNEVAMLHENYHVFLENKFKVIFILTHNIEKSKSTHQDVISFFLKTNYKLIFECEHPIVGSDSLLIYTTDKNLIMLYDEN